MEFSKFLNKIRKEKGLTQSELAQKLNVSDKTISKWETGNGFPESSLLVPLADIFDLTVDELLRGIKIEKDLNEKAKTQIEEHNEDETLKEYIEKERAKSNLNNFNRNTLDKNETIIVATSVPIMLIGICIATILGIMGLSYGIYLPVLFATLSISVGMLSSMGMKKGVKVLKGEITKSLTKKINLISIGVALLIFSPTVIVGLYPFGVHVAIYMSLFSLVITASLGMLIFGGVSYGNYMAELAITNVAHLNTEDKEYFHKKTRKESICGAICGVLMILSTVAFLIAGLCYGIWHPSWVSFLIGGMLCGVVGIIMDVKK